VHRDRCIEETTIGCDDLEWCSVAQVEVVVTSLAGNQQAEAILAGSDVEVWLDLAIDSEQVSDLTFVLELIEEEGAISVQDVVCENERYIVLSAWQT